MNRSQDVARSLLSAVGSVIVFVLIIWLSGRMIGFEISLWFTLIASVVLTLVLNLVMGGFRRIR